MPVQVGATPVASLAASRAQLNYRPLRRLYSIQQDDRSSARDVIRHATKLWGGVYDLIALEREYGRWDGFTRYGAESVDPDLVVVAGGTREGQVERGRRVRASCQFDVVTVRGQVWEPHARPLTTILPTGAIPYAAPASANLWEAAAWGDTSSSLVELPLDELRALEGNEIPAPADVWEMPAGRVMRAVMLGETAIDATGGGVSLRHGQSLLRFAWILVPITAPDALEDIVLFWNTRAVYAPHHVRVVPWPLWAGEAALEPAREIMRIGFADGMHSTEPDVLVACPDLATLAAAKAAMPALYSLTEYTGNKLSTFWPPRRRESPPTASYAIPPLPAFQRLSCGLSSEYPVQVGDELRLQLDPPEAFLRADRRMVALDLVDFSPVVMPRRPELAALVQANARATAAGQSWTGWFTRSEWAVKVPTDKRIFEVLAGRAGLTMTLGPWGEAAQRTLGLLGGLPGVSVLQDDVALRVLGTLADSREAGSGRPRPDEKSALAMSEIASRLWPGDPKKGKKTVAAPLDRLVQAALVFAGLRMTCEACGTAEWRIVDDVRSEMVCRGCRAPLPLRLKSERYDHLEPTWEYRENQLLVWPVSQGVLPGLMALKVLAGSAAHRFRYLLGREIEGVGEVDALMTIDRDVAVLEVKAGAELNQFEVERTVTLARRLNGRAIFATEAPAWAPPTLERLRALAQTEREAEAPVLVQSLTREHLLGITAVPPSSGFGGITESRV